MIITTVRPSDMGVYRCMAENDSGIASSNAELRVESKYADERKCPLTMSRKSKCMDWTDHFLLSVHTSFVCCMFFLWNRLL